MRFAILLGAVLAAGTSAIAQEAPVFRPGMYATESVNSRFPDHPVKSDVCMKSASLEAFRDQTLEAYRKSPEFNAACKLGPVEAISDGFTFSMTCDGANHKLDFKFGKDEVTQIIATEILQMPEISSTATTTMRRTGDCEG